MTPTQRVATALIGALVLGGLGGSGFSLLIGALDDQRQRCLTDSPQPSVAGCNLLVNYPNRLPALVGLLVVVALGIVVVLTARWCLHPFRQLVSTIEQLGPTNLGHRTGMGAGRSGVFAALARGLDAMMDRIAGGYESQRRFAANASHELRTPLAVQRTLIEVGMAEPLTGDQLTLLTTQLLTTNQRNERLIEGLLTLAEAEQTPVGHTPQRLDQVARAVVETYRDRAAAAGIRLDYDAVPSTVSGEDVLIERLMTNLVQNAIAYNRAGGSVQVTVLPGSVSVTNTGPVIPVEEVSALFEPFRRGSGDRLTYSGGAGLGLTICRAIVRAHQATIRAEPGPAGGLAVQVDFPAAPGPRLSRGERRPGAG